jgi:hypothetical protein
MAGRLKQEDHSPGQSGQKETISKITRVKRDPISKITGVKRASGVTQVVQHLPSTHHLYLANPGTAKKKDPKPGEPLISSPFS